MVFKKSIALSLLAVLVGCTKGHLTYITPDGQQKTACATEYTWQPEVDKYAVEYVLAYCAKKAQAKGYQVLDESLLTLDLTLPTPPAGLQWSHQLAKEQHLKKAISDRDYGYLIAWLDLQQSVPE